MLPPNINNTFRKRVVFMISRIQFTQSSIHFWTVAHSTMTSVPLVSKNSRSLNKHTEQLIHEYVATNRYTVGQPLGVQVCGSHVYLLKGQPQALYRFDAVTQHEEILVTPEILTGKKSDEVEVLSLEEQARRERMRIFSTGIVQFTFDEAKERILIPYQNGLYVYNIAAGKALRVTDEKNDNEHSPEYSMFGPKNSLIYTRNSDIYYAQMDTVTGTYKEKRLTNRSVEPNSAKISYGIAEFIAMEELSRFNGMVVTDHYLVYQRTDNSSVDLFYIADPADPSKAPNVFPYPRPGTNNAVVELFVIDLDKLGETEVPHEKAVKVQWDNQKFVYLAALKSSKVGNVTVQLLDRVQQHKLLCAVNLQTGALDILHSETNTDTWVNHDPSTPSFVPASDGKPALMLWADEQGKAWRLGLYHIDGRLIRHLHSEDVNFRKLLYVDEKNMKAYMAAAPISQATQQHIYMLDLGNIASEQRITADGTFNIGTFGSPLYFVLEERSLSHFPVTTVRSLKEPGSVVSIIPSKVPTPPSVADAEIVAFTVKSSTGEEIPLNAVIVKPHNFDSRRKYPVIAYTYGGPHAQVVINDQRALAYHNIYASADYVVISIDNRGTPHKGKHFERAIYKNFIRKAIEDQTLGIKALGERFPWIDVSRLGVTGWSWGGYFSIMAVLLAPDTFKASVSGAPVVQWQSYDTGYTERYMSLPSLNPDGYNDSSCLTHADKLDRPLLLIHGSSDDNVYFSNSILLTDKLFKAGKEFEFVPLLNETHMVKSKALREQIHRRTIAFFDKTL